jgi:Putative Flp pilus-assembly TadE/G-like
MKKLNNETGQTLIFVALSMTMLVGVAALATDMGVVLHVKREAQTAADAAAIAAATEELAEGNPTTISEGVWNAAAKDATANGFSAAAVASNPGGQSGVKSYCSTSNGLCLYLGSAGSITVPTFNSAGYVQATITQPAPTLFTNAFMGLFGNSSYSGMTVATTAIASDTITNNGCVYVTDPGAAANPAVDMGGSSLVDTPNCGVSIDGNLDMSGDAHMDAKYVNVSGTITGNKPSGPYASGSGAILQTIPPFLTALSFTANQPTLSTSKGVTTCTAPTGSGLACLYDYQGGALSGQLPSNTIFYFDEPAGPSITGSVTGSGVVLYLSGTSMPFDFSNNGSVTLTPPTSGTFEGVLIDAPSIGGTTTCSHGKGNNQGNPGELYFDFGSSTTSLDGIVYAPNAQLFGQDQGANSSINLDLVVGNICLQSSTFTIGGISADNPITKVGLVY